MWHGQVINKQSKFIKKNRIYDPQSSREEITIITTKTWSGQWKLGKKKKKEKVRKIENKVRQQK